ncbi:hypothetical protein KXJ69_08365 [Aureisphaera sp. CAU 1614]|uniref:Uncharacterized protein n=1 Tax=Halomarinibacterium sedimenti TaxID=2857106 RepID=A0A9X1JXG8_9FLAO|nr:hypothetical protein [Halomarinibacterium sedimenti]MBW2938118.1 hypothetical protein [Halomarinibacterium sedimenti]
MKSLLLFIFFVPFLAFSQVGINTTTPQATLDVNGTLRVTNTTGTNSAKVIGVDSNGTVTQVGVGSNLSLDSGVLNASGSNKYLVRLVPTVTLSSGHKFNNLNLDLNGVNKDIVVFRLTGSSHNFEVTGIQGGTDGKHIILLNVSANNFRLSDESSDSLAINRIITLAGSFEATSGQGSAELVYDGISQRWIILNFRN